MKLRSIIFSAAVACAVLPLHADLIVDLDSTALPVGPAASWTNNGTLGGVFSRTRLDATVDVNNGTQVTTVSGVNTMTFDGAADYFISSLPVPASLNAAGVRTVELWAFNPVLGAEETMFSWSRRGGPNGVHQTFNYGNDARWGAGGHWGTGNDIGWGLGDVVNAPAAGVWHHLVYTFDGAFDRLYVDGVLVNQEYAQVTAVNTAATYTAAPNAGVATRFAIATQMENTGVPAAGQQGSMSIARARVWNEVRSAADIRTKYNQEAATFGRPLLPGPSVKTFSVSPAVFAPGQQVAITYDVPGATSLTVDNGVGALPGTSGTVLVTPASVSTLYTLTATDGTGSNTAKAKAHFRDQLPVLRHRYSFNEGSGTTVTDSVGGAHGTIKGAPFLWNETAAGAANRAGQLVLNNGVAANTTTTTSAYVDLPNGLLTGRYGEFTIEGWVTNEIAQTWARVFDFGTHNFNETTAAVQNVGGTSTGTEYLFLSAQEGANTANTRYALKRDNVEDGATLNVGTVLGTQFHFAVVYDRDGNSGAPQMRLYRNGVLVSTTNTVKSPEGFLDVNCWLGRSAYTGDRQMSGSFNEFRIYDGAFSAGDAAASFAQGPTVPYDPTNLAVAIAAQPINTTVAKNSPASFSVQATGTPPIAYQWYRNGVAIPGATSATYALSPATIVDHGATFYCVLGNNPLSGPASATSSTVTLNVNYAAESLRNRYPFSGNLNDVIGGANATPVSNNGGAAPAAGASSVTFAAAQQQYLTIPPSGANSLNVHTHQQVTFEAWASFGTIAGWGRLFDVGNTNGANTQGFNYVFFTPHSGANDARFGVRDPLNVETVVANTPVLDNLGMTHVVCIYDPVRGKMQLFLNGALAVESTSTLPALSMIGAATGSGPYRAYIGRALFNDPYVDMTLDEFRVYNVALTAAEISGNYAAGPDTVPVAPTTLAFSQHPSSQTVQEPASVTFSVDVDGPKPITAQWYKNNVAVNGATSLVYSYSPLPSDNGAVFFCRVSATVGGNPTTLDSNSATLTVVADSTAPTVASAFNSGATKVIVNFSEPVDSGTATSLENYAVSGGVTISGATLSADGKRVTLTTSALSFGTDYTVTINNILDRASTPNVIAANTQRTFTATPFTITDFGAPTTGGVIGTGGGGYTLAALGSGPTGTTDQFTLASQTITGDFDLQVRIGDLTLSDNWARAGIMARDGTLDGSAFAAAVATPGVGGAFFSSRFPSYSAATHAGSFPVNYPNTWLRLKRAGNLFTAYAGLDGVTWTPLSSATIALPAALEVGPFVSSANATAASSGSFFSYGATASATIANNPTLPFEPDGPSNRFGVMVISEIMYNPNPVNGAGNLEFIEIHNTSPYPEDLSGWKFKGGIDYTFPNGTVVNGGGYLVVAAIPANVQTAYGVGGVLGPWTGSLANGGEAFRLENEVGGTVWETDYDDEGAWPIAAAGLGHSIVLAKPSYGERDPRAWAASNVLGGSPGRRDPYTADALRSVIINEFLANTDAPDEDFVELFNTSNTPVDLSGVVIGDGALLTAGYTLPPGTIIAARGYLSFTQSQLGFSLGSDGERLWLYRPGVLIGDAISFSGQALGVSRDHDQRELATPTPGAVNSAVKDRPIVINEIMYNPISGLGADEYIELYNKSGAAVDVGGWKIGGNIDYTIPAGTSIAAGGYLVIAKDPANLLAKGHAALNATNTLGAFTGSLPNGGGRITLRIPVSYIIAPATPATTYAIVDEVIYSDGGRWGIWSDGGGSSLELRDPRADNSIAANWSDSDESGKSSYTTGTITDIHNYRHNSAQGVANRAEFFLQGQGEVLVDELSIKDGANVEYVINGGFESGIGAWVAQGDQKNAFIQASGAAAGANCLRIVSSERGDTGANRVRSALTTTLVDNVNHTLSAKVRWLRGSRFFHFRSRGNGLELAMTLDVPSNLGTPGAANSIAAANVGPAIHSVAHAPVLPAGGENVVITARISDPDGVGAVNLLWRNDTAAPGVTNTLAMNDAGTNGDTFAGDGIYSTTLTGLATGSLAAFRIQAADTAGAPLTATFPTPHPLIFPVALQTRECLVRFGETPQYGTLGAYRLWTTTATVTEWAAREKNSNGFLDATFVIGNYRTFYNVTTQYSGSPWHAVGFTSPVAGNPCDYEVNFAGDDRFLGTTDFILQAQNGPNFTVDATCQAELTAFWMGRKMGLFANHKRHVHWFINGTRRAIIYEDAQQPNGDSPDQYLRSTNNGTLFKIEDWFEFDDAGAVQNNWNANLPATTTTINGVPNQKKMARYRWNWRIRSQDDPNEYGAFFNLVDAMNAVNTPTDTAFVNGLNQIVDMENWLGTLLAHRIVGNWDSYGYERGKNGYAFKPDEGRWVHFLWDMDFAFGLAQQSRASNSDIFAVNADGNNMNNGQPETAKIFNTPAFRRQYLAAAKRAANGPLSGSANPMLDARYSDFVNNGLTVFSPAGIKQFISERRSYLLSVQPVTTLALTSPTSLTTATSPITVTGTAPSEVATIEVNGIDYGIRWTSVTAWALDVPLLAGANTLNLVAKDIYGTTLGTLGPISANYTGTNAWGGIVINEWAADNDVILDPADGDKDDWFELYNPTASAISLAGWILEDTQPTPTSYVIPAGYSIPAGGRLIVWADDETIQNTGSGQLHVPFKLSASGDTITLRAPDTSVIDTVTFGQQVKNITQGRVPDGGATIDFLAASSLGGTNGAAVQPPTPSIAAMGGGVFQFTVTATPGFSYQVQYKDDLNAATWTNLGTPIVATGATVTVSDTPSPQTQRFYRAVRTP